MLSVAFKRAGGLIEHMHIPEHKNMLGLHFKYGPVENHHAHPSDYNIMKKKYAFLIADKVGTWSKK